MTRDPTDTTDGSRSRADQLHELVEEYHDRIACGEANSIDEFVAEHPKLESDLRRILPITSMLADFSGDKTDDLQPANAPVSYTHLTLPTIYSV